MSPRLHDLLRAVATDINLEGTWLAMEAADLLRDEEGIEDSATEKSS